MAVKAAMYSTARTDVLPPAIARRATYQPGVSVDRSDADQGSNLMAADSPEFGQFGEKGPGGHVADARDGFQKCPSLAPSWGMFDGFPDVMVDRVELLLKKSNMACESSGEMLVDGLEIGRASCRE